MKRLSALIALLQVACSTSPVTSLADGSYKIIGQGGDEPTKRATVKAQRFCARSGRVASISDVGEWQDALLVDVTFTCTEPAAVERSGR